MCFLELPWTSLINQLINQPINHRGWRINYPTTAGDLGYGSSLNDPHLSASGLTPIPVRFISF